MMKNILKSTKWYILLVLTTILFSLSYFFFLQQNYLHITAKFKEFRPVHEKIDVFYKGLKIGYVQKMELCEETQRWWTHTKPCFVKYSILPEFEFYADMKQIFYFE